jgi:hypothetical protein
MKKDKHQQRCAMKFFFLQGKDARQYMENRKEPSEKRMGHFLLTSSIIYYQFMPPDAIPAYRGWAELKFFSDPSAYIPHRPSALSRFLNSRASTVLCTLPGRSNLGKCQRI